MGTTPWAMAVAAGLLGLVAAGAVPPAAAPPDEPGPTATVGAAPAPRPGRGCLPPVGTLRDLGLMRPFEAPRHRYGPGHRGVDLAAPPGTRVVSPCDGVVAFAGAVAGRPVMAIDHAGGLRSAVEPVLPSVLPGTPVSAGTPIGTVAGGGRHCVAPCVHWGVRRSGDYVDPLALLRPRVVLVPLSSRRPA